MILFAFTRLLQTLKAGQEHLARLHQIPCSGCQYFTGDYSLKCTVHPYEALTEDAISCLDFEKAILQPAYPTLARYLEQSAKTVQSNLTTTQSFGKSDYSLGGIP